MNKTLINPQTKRRIKIGSQTHLTLIHKNILPRETLDENKISIVENSRQKMERVDLIYTKKSTHFTNIKKIAEQIGLKTPYLLIDYFAREFDTMKICVSPQNITIIFPGREPFIQNIMDDFIKSLKKELSDWNQ